MAITWGSERYGAALQLEHAAAHRVHEEAVVPLEGLVEEGVLGTELSPASSDFLELSVTFSDFL